MSIQQGINQAIISTSRVARSINSNASVESNLNDQNAQMDDYYREQLINRAGIDARKKAIASKSASIDYKSLESNISKISKMKGAELKLLATNQDLNAQNNDYEKMLK